MKEDYYKMAQILLGQGKITKCIYTDLDGNDEIIDIIGIGIMKNGQSLLLFYCDDSLYPLIYPISLNDNIIKGYQVGYLKRDFVFKNFLFNTDNIIKIYMYQSGDFIVFDEDLLMNESSISPLGLLISKLRNSEQCEDNLNKTLIKKDKCLDKIMNLIKELEDY